MLSQIGPASAADGFRCILRTWGTRLTTRGLSRSCCLTEGWERLPARESKCRKCMENKQ